jgi:hypothetical protein
MSSRAPGWVAYSTLTNLVGTRLWLNSFKTLGHGRGTGQTGKPRNESIAWAVTCSIHVSVADPRDDRMRLLTDTPAGLGPVPLTPHSSTSSSRASRSAPENRSRRPTVAPTRLYYQSGARLVSS